MKIIDDTLKGPNGKYSRKSLTTVVSLFVAIFYGVVAPFVAGLFGFKFVVIEFVFISFITLAGATLGMTVADKMKKYGGDGGEQ
jgi:hypothetical protein